MKRKARTPKVDPAQLDLAALAAAPLAEPGKIYLPAGRKRSRKMRTPAELEAFRDERQAKKARADRDAIEHREQLFDYYAKTEVPIARVAANTGTSEARARDELTKRGRAL